MFPFQPVSRKKKRIEKSEMSISIQSKEKEAKYEKSVMEKAVSDDMFIRAKDIYGPDDVKSIFESIKIIFNNIYDINNKITIIEDFTKIQKYKGKHRQNINGNHIAIAIYDKWERDNEIMTDYFVDIYRMEAYRCGSRSPMEYFKSGDWKKVYLKEISKFRNISEKTKYKIFRNVITRGYRVKECNTFPYSVSLAVYRIFKPRRILDMSSGWGDRLISAMMYQPEIYVGVDPNKNLRKCYSEMIETLADSCDKYKMITKSFEDIKENDFGFDPEGYFDMMFSCPPYFIAEHYSEDEGQSHCRYKNIDSWLGNFMFPSLEKCWRYLNNGGFLVFVLNDTWVENFGVVHYTENVLSFVDNLPNSKFYGMLKYKIGNIVQPIWVYQKLVTISKQILDKPVVVDTINDGKVFHVVREDLLIGGTKQRICLQYVKSIRSQHLFYRGPVNGFAQVALSYACLLENKTMHLILNRQYHGKYPVTCLAMIFGAVVHDIRKQQNKNIESQQIENIMSRYNNPFLIPLGLPKNTSEYYFETCLKSFFNKVKPDHIWIVASSGLVYNFLKSILPDTIFSVVYVGHKPVIHPSDTLYSAPERFRQPATLKPPYPSELSYDAKLWSFASRFGSDGDFIFNVAGI